MAHGAQAHAHTTQPMHRPHPDTTATTSTTSVLRKPAPPCGGGLPHNTAALHAQRATGNSRTDGFNCKQSLPSGGSSCAPPRSVLGGAEPSHGAPASVKLESAFLATFAAMTIGNLAKR